MLTGRGTGPSSELDGGDAVLLDSQPPVRNTCLLFISHLVCGCVTEVQWTKGGMLSPAFLRGCGAALTLLAVPLPPGLSPHPPVVSAGPCPSGSHLVLPFQPEAWGCLQEGGCNTASLTASQAWPCRQRGAPGKVPGPGVRKGRRGPDLQRVTGESTRAASGSCPGSPYPLGTLVAAVTPPHPILLPLPWNRLGGTVPRGRHGVQGPGQVRVVPGGKSPESTLGVGGC